MAIKIGIIGLGTIAWRHLNSLREVGKTELVAICDVDKQKTAAVQKEFGGKVYFDFNKMFAEQPLDAILICTPPTVRYEPIAEAARRNIAIFCEKPPAFDLITAKKIEEVVKKSKVLNSVGFMWRYNRITDRAKQLIQGHTISLMRSVFLCHVISNPNIPDWFLLKERSGGPLLDQAIHLLDVSRYLLGDILSLHTFGNNLVVPKSEKVTIEDSHSLNLQFTSGVVGNHLHSWSYRGSIARIELYAQKLCLVLDYGANSIYGKVENVKVNEKMDDNPYITELERFLDAVEQKEQSILRSSYKDAVKTLAVGIAANKSFQTKKIEKVVI